MRDNSPVTFVDHRCFGCVDCGAACVKCEVFKMLRSLHDASAPRIHLSESYRDALRKAKQRKKLLLTR